MKTLTLHVIAGDDVTAFVSSEARRLFASIFGLDLQETADASADIILESAVGHGENPQAGKRDLVKDSFTLDCIDGRVHITANTDIALLIALYRLAFEFGARFPRPGEELLPHLSGSDFRAKRLNIDETASYAHRGACIEGADSLANVEDFIDWLPKIGMNSFFIQFENPYSFFKRWYEHEFNPYEDHEEFSTDIAQSMSDEVDDEMRRRGIIQHRVGHGWTGDVLGYSSKYGWEKGVTLPEEKKPLVALVNGKRDLFAGAPILTSLDFANPKVIPMMVDCVVDYAKKHPDVDYLHVWLSDECNNICECDECRQTTPSDQYVEFLNALDDELTREGLDTRICFLLYHELLFAPVKASIKNPARFTMMFAPISRSFESSYADIDYPADVPGQPAYLRNKFVMPHGLKENLSSLVAWKKIFEGDSFVYDYPLGRAHYGDFGYMAISDVIYRDIRSLDRLGLNGYIACQELRAGFPTNFPDYVMGRTLWNKDISYDSLVEEYFSSLYGTQWRKAVDWLRQMSRLSSCDYFNGIGDRVNPQKAQDYAAIVRLSDGALDLIRREIGTTTGLVKKEWVKLSFYREYVMLISAALCAQAGGDAAEADKKWNECLDFIRRNERNIQNELDVYRVIEVAKNYAGFTLSD